VGKKKFRPVVAVWIIVVEDEFGVADSASKHVHCHRFVIFWLHCAEDATQLAGTITAPEYL